MSSRAEQLRHLPISERAPALNGHLPESFAAMRAEHERRARLERRRLNRPQLYDQHGGAPK